MDITIQRPKRPKPVVPIVYGALATFYAVMSVAFFVVDMPFAGAVWAVCVLIWLGFTLPMSIRNHRSRVRLWQQRCELLARLEAIDRRRAERINDFIGGES
jgi:hypothetical protein